MKLTIKGNYINKKDLRRVSLKLYKKASSFFSIELSKLQIYVIKDLKIICKVFKIKKKIIPWYAVGFYKNNNIYIFDKSLFKTRGHNENEFNGVLLHEMCHIFLRRIIGKPTKVWIEEGLCQYIAFKNKNPKLNSLVSLEELNTIKDWYRFNHPYLYCSLFFDFLIKRYEKEKVIKFLYLLKNKEVKEAFLKSFNLNLDSCENIFRDYLKNEKII